MSIGNAIHLSTVADVFFIEGRGLVLLPGIPYPSGTIPNIRRGSPLTLRRPDGSVIDTSVKELEMIRRLPVVPFIPFTVTLPLRQGDIPVGTEIWYTLRAEDTFVPPSE